MKFREFVGEKKVEKAKREVIQTSIGPTERDFLRNVLRENPDGSRIKKKQPIEKFLNFGLSKQKLKRIFDYIKSWLIRYDVPFQAINPCLTLYLLRSLPTSSNFIDTIKRTKGNELYKPKGTITIVSSDEDIFPAKYNLKAKEGRDYILLDYKPNEYNTFIEGITEEMGIKIVSKQCYIKLFEIDSGILTPKDYSDMMFYAPSLPDLRLGSVGIIRSK